MTAGVGGPCICLRVATDLDVPALFDIRISVLENTQTSAGLARVGVTPESVRHMLHTTSRAWLVEVNGTPVAFSMANAVDRTIWLDTGSDPGLRAHGFYRHLGWHRTEIRHDDQVRYVRRRDQSREQTAP